MCYYSSMSNKNPRSKLSQMKRKYFFSVILYFVSYFLITLLVAEILFTITEAIPTIRLVVIIFLIVTDIIFTNYVLNSDLKQWLRAPIEISFEKMLKKGYNTPKDIERKEYQIDKTSRESVVGENRQQVTEKSSGSSLGETKQ